MECGIVEVKGGEVQAGSVWSTVTAEAERDEGRFVFIDVAALGSP